MTAVSERSTLERGPGSAGDWRDRAACADEDPDLFFPAKGQPAGPARRICAMCPVREQCLDYALASGIRYGVWGGLSERERRPLPRPVKGPRLCRKDLHVMDEANTYTSPSGERNCRACTRSREQKRREDERARLTGSMSPQPGSSLAA